MNILKDKDIFLEFFLRYGKINIKKRVNSENSKVFVRKPNKKKKLKFQ